MVNKAALENREREKGLRLEVMRRYKQATRYTERQIRRDLDGKRFIRDSMGRRVSATEGSRAKIVKEVLQETDEPRKWGVSYPEWA